MSVNPVALNRLPFDKPLGFKLFNCGVENRSVPATESLLQLVLCHLAIGLQQIAAQKSLHAPQGLCLLGGTHGVGQLALNVCCLDLLPVARCGDESLGLVAQGGTDFQQVSGKFPIMLSDSGTAFVQAHDGGGHLQLIEQIVVLLCVIGQATIQRHNSLFVYQILDGLRHLQKLKLCRARRLVQMCPQGHFPVGTMDPV